MKSIARGIKSNFKYMLMDSRGVTNAVLIHVTEALYRGEGYGT